MIYVIVGRRVREIREKKRLTQGELAEGTGLSRTSITNLEAGTQRVTLTTLYQLAKVLKVEIGDLIPDISTIDRAEKVIGLPATTHLTHSRKRGKVSRRR